MYFWLFLTKQVGECQQCHSNGNVSNKGECQQCIFDYFWLNKLGNVSNVSNGNVSNKGECQLCIFDYFWLNKLGNVSNGNVSNKGECQLCIFDYFWLNELGNVSNGNVSNKGECQLCIFDYFWLNELGGQWKLGGLRGTRGGWTPRRIEHCAAHSGCKPSSSMSSFTHSLQYIDTNSEDEILKFSQIICLVTARRQAHRRLIFIVITWAIVNFPSCSRYCIVWRHPDTPGIISTLSACLQRHCLPIVWTFLWIWTSVIWKRCVVWQKIENKINSLSSMISLTCSLQRTLWVVYIVF